MTFCLVLCQISTSAPSRLRSARLGRAPTPREASPVGALRASSSPPPDADVWVSACASGLGQAHVQVHVTRHTVEGFESGQASWTWTPSSRQVFETFLRTSF